MPDLNKNSVVVSQSSTVSQTGQTERFVNVSYKLGDHGPFTLTIPEAQFSAATVNAAIDKMRTEITGITA